MESQIQLVLFAIELERQLEAHQEKDQILDDYRQKAIDMEEQHIHELDGLKEFFQKTVQEQTVKLPFELHGLKFLSNRKKLKIYKNILMKKKCR